MINDQPSDKVTQTMQLPKKLLAVTLLFWLRLPVLIAEEATVVLNSKLCPDSPVQDNVIYVYHNVTKSCFRIGTRGPCSDSMIFYADPRNPDLGQCDCDISIRCTRPMIYWKPRNQCYRIFDQGPCPAGQWLTLRDGRVPICEPDPCVRSQGEFDPVDPKEFWIHYAGECILTGSYGMCRYSNEKVIFNGFARSVGPICSAVTFKCILPSVPSLICVPGQKWHQDGCEPEDIVSVESATTDLQGGHTNFSWNHQHHHYHPGHRPHYHNHHNNSPPHYHHHHHHNHHPYHHHKLHHGHHNLPNRNNRNFEGHSGHHNHTFETRYHKNETSVTLRNVLPSDSSVHTVSPVNRSMSTAVPIVVNIRRILSRS